MREREKSEIERLIEERLKKVKNTLSSLEEKPWNERTKAEEKRVQQYTRERDFLISLLSEFGRLEDMRSEQDENTYDYFKMKYILDNLPPQLSESLQKAISEDRKKVRKEEEKDNTKKLEERKKKIISNIRNLCANQKYERYRHVNDSIVKKIKSRIEVIEENNSRKKRNEDVYEDIIKWIERYFVARYLNRYSGKTYYVDASRGQRVMNPSFVGEEAYKEFTEGIDNQFSVTKDARTIELCQELLSFTSLNKEAKSKIQKYKDLLKQHLKITKIISCLRSLNRNSKFEQTKKERDRIYEELTREEKKYRLRIEKLESEIDISRVYFTRKDEIEEMKAAKTAEERKKEDLKRKEEEYVDPIIEQSNEKWKKEFVQESIKIILGREPSLEDEKSSKYPVIRSLAEKHLTDYLAEINERYSKWLSEGVRSELIKYITEAYQTKTDKEVQSIISYAMMSPEERYIKYMVDAKKLPSGTTVDDLAGKDYEEMEKKSELFSKTDIRIKTYIEQIKKIQSTRFTSIYGIQKIVDSLSEIDREQTSGVSLQ